MKAPICRMCGEAHWSRERCKVAVNVAAPVVNRVATAVNTTPAAVNATVNKAVNETAPTVNRKRGAYPATDARREYMRGYMARRRAA